MNLQDIKQYLTDNKDSQEVQDYLKGLKTVSVDDVKGFLDTEEGKRFIQPELDRYHAKSLNTWKENNLEKLVNEEVAKRNPELTEEQKRISALEQELEKRDAEAKREKLLNFALNKAQELKLPTTFVERYLGDDEETTEQNLNSLNETLESIKKDQIDNYVKANGRTDFTDGQSDSVKSASLSDLISEANIRNN